MSSTGEPVLHALSLEPRTARAGETVLVTFKTRNVGLQATPAAAVRFVLDDGLEALDATEVEIAGVAPGEHAVATLRARALGPVADRTVLTVRAVLSAGDRLLPTNACALLVRSRAVVDGPASGTFVEALGGDMYRVRAVVANEGDGPAFGLRAAVPPPIGCVTAEGGETALEIERLDPGERSELVFDVRVVEPVREVRADDGAITLGSGGAVALPARDAVALEPAIGTPRASMTVARRSVALSVDVPNDGWADALDVPVRIELPPSVRPIEGSFAIDDIPLPHASARRAPAGAVKREGTAFAFAAPFVPARGAARITLAAWFPASFAGDAVRVHAGPHVLEVPIVLEPVRDVRVNVVEAPRTIVPGESARIVLRVANGGDVTERLAIRLDDGAPAECDGTERTLSPGSAAVVPLTLLLARGVEGGAAIPIGVVVSDAAGERARAVATVHVRHPARSAPDDVSAGAQTEAGSLARVASCSSGSPASATLHVPPRVVRGVPFRTALDVRVPDGAGTVTVRVAFPAACRYVFGSTTLDACPLLDAIGNAERRSPLEGDGLVLHAVPAGAAIRLAWSAWAVRDASGDGLRFEATADCDGALLVAHADPIEAADPEGFAVRPAGLPYHVDACVIQSPFAIECAGDAGPVHAADAVVPATDADRVADGTEAPADDEQRENPEFSMRLDAARLVDLGRFVNRSRDARLADHLLVLRFFFPDALACTGETGALALGALREAVADTLDRLCVKLRIPGFDLASDDVEDAAMRDAAIALFDRLPRKGRFDPGAPLGAPRVLRALLSLLPSRCDDEPQIVWPLRRYADVLDQVLSRYDGLPLELFDEALVRGTDRALEAAREEMLAVVRAQLGPAHVTC
jgi:hypothetical protein